MAGFQQSGNLVDYEGLRDGGEHAGDEGNTHITRIGGAGGSVEERT
jgi:hypothetical protein